MCDLHSNDNKSIWSIIVAFFPSTILVVYLGTKKCASCCICSTSRPPVVPVICGQFGCYAPFVFLLPHLYKRDSLRGNKRCENGVLVYCWWRLFTLCSGPGCSYPLREDSQERDWRFYYAQKQESFQADDPTDFRQGARGKLLKIANIIFHLGLHWTLFSGKLDTKVHTPFTISNYIKEV